MAVTAVPAELLQDDFPYVYTATYKTLAVKGIFGREFLEQLGVQTSAPAFLAAKSDLAGVADGDAITINSIAYTVREYQHDPHGFQDWTLLFLKV